MLPPGFLHRDAELEGVTLHLVEGGQGPTVVLLHGFPEFWYAWRHQLEALSAAGFRVIAPDLRGYNLSSKPRELQAYSVDALAADIARLIRSLGESPVALAGHDWGGVVAYRVAMEYPELLTRLVILNAPHPVQYRRALRTAAQFRRAWYAMFFQLPLVPELYLRARGFRRLRRVLEKACIRQGGMTAEDVELYIESFALPGALTAALNLYRAALRCPAPRDVKIHVPTLILQGAQDRFLTELSLSPSKEWVTDQRTQRILDAGHFVQHDCPGEVNAALVTFLREG